MTLKAQPASDRSTAKVPFGVATSVSAANSFDPLDALEYAASHSFSLVQVYISPPFRSDPVLRRRVIDRAAQHKIDLITHAPGLLVPEDALAPDVVCAALEIRRNNQPFVVYHLDERQPLEVSLDTLLAIAQQGIVPCIENFHQKPNRTDGRAFYGLYLKVLRILADRSVPAIAVLDIPRIYNRQLGFDDAAAEALATFVVREIGQLRVPLLLHLIDSTSRNLDRSNWCPLGQGVIPYTRLLQPLTNAEFVLDSVVLEYEDKVNPLASLQFLKDLLDR